MRGPKKKRASSSIKREADDRKSEIEGKFHSLADQNSSNSFNELWNCCEIESAVFFLKKNKIVDKGEWVDGNTKQKNPISTAAATAAAKNKKHKKKMAVGWSMEIYELPPFYLSWSVRSKKEKKYLFSLCLGIFFFTSNFPAAHSAVTAARPRVVSPINVGHGVEFIKIRAVFNCFFLLFLFQVNL